MLRNWSFKQFVKIGFSYIVFVTTIVSGFLLLYLVHTFLLINKIEVVYLKGSKPVDLVGIDLIKEETMLTLREQEIAETLTKLNPYVESISVQRLTPGRVRLEVRTYTPYVLLQTKEGYFLLAADGTVLEKTREPIQGYPVMKYYQNFNYLATQAGNTLDYQDILLAISFLKQLEGYGIMIKTIDIVGFHMIRLVSDKEKEYLFTTEKELNVQQYQLDTLLKAIARKGEDYKLIDVRFDKPIYQPIK